MTHPAQPLDVEYASGYGSIGDAMERILDLVKGGAAMRENIRQAGADQGDISDDPIAQAICGVGPVVCDDCGDEFTQTGPAAQSLAKPGTCVYCFTNRED